MTAYEEYRAATDGLPFAKDFLGAINAVVGDGLAPSAQRVLAWIKVRAWGKQRLHCVRDDGAPAGQKDCVEELGLSKGTISKAVAYLDSRGYIRTEGKLLYPVLSPTLAPPPDPEVSGMETFLVWLDTYKVSNAETFGAWEAAKNLKKQAISEERRLASVVHCEYKKSLPSKQKRAPSLLNKTKKTLKTVRTDEDPPPVLEPPPPPGPSVPPPEPEPAPLRESVRDFLTGGFDLSLPLDRDILDQISSEIVDEAVFRRFSNQIREQRPRPRRWGYFVPIAKACRQAQATADAFYREAEAIFLAEQQSRGGEVWVPAEAAEPATESPQPKPPPARDEERENSQKETTARRRASEKAAIDERRQTFAKPPASELGVRIETLLKAKGVG